MTTAAENMRFYCAEPNLIRIGLSLDNRGFHKTGDARSARYALETRL